MPKRLNIVLKVPRKEFESRGIYNSLIDFDSRLHIDPALVEATGIIEFKDSKKEVIRYFTDVLRLVKSSTEENDIFWNAALSKLSFGEGLNTALGYSATGTGGSGIGSITASTILHSIKKIQEAGINDPEIFELVGVFEENIGPDRISDMISIILKKDFRNYTQRLCRELNIKTRLFKFDDIPYHLPINPKTGEHLIFVPTKMLNDLPIADDWEDVPMAAQYSQKVKDNLNTILGNSWREFRKISKSKLKEVLLENPEMLRELLMLYKKRAKKGYDFDVDHLGELIWDIIGEDASKKNPLDLKAFGDITEKNILEVAHVICDHFKKLIEENGLVEHIYDSNGDRRPERFPQLLLFAVADSYCNANDLDLSREPNAGSGALDFKVSRGLKKVSVEIKYSSNPKLVEGYEKQLTAYNKAETIKANNSVYLIIRVNENNDHKIKSIQKMIEEREKKNHPSPILIIVDGIKKPSASKR